MTTHVVVRPFDADGRRLDTGTRVDASAWRNTRLLVEQGYLAPAPPEPDAQQRSDAKPIPSKGKGV